MNINEETDKYPLTCYQMDIWLEQIMFPDDSFYNVGAYFTIKGLFNYSIFEEAVNILIKENDALSIQLEEDGIEIFQRFVPKPDNNVQFYDFTKETNPIEYSINWMKNEFLKPFDIESDSLFKNYIIKATEDIHYWFTKAHHLVTDGMGYSLIDKRVVEIYNAIINGQVLCNREIYSYKDFIKKDLEYQKSSKHKADGLFWQKIVENPPEAFLQARKNNNKKITGKSLLKTLVLKRDFYNDILCFCEENNCTIFHFLIGILYICISKIYSKNSLCIGIAVLNRNNTKFKKTIGHFVNIVPLILNYEDEYSIEELFTDIRKMLFNCYRHIKYPLSEIIKKADVKSKDKLFDITLSYEKSNHSWELCNAKKNITRLYHNTEKDAIDICVKEYSEKNDVEIDFNYQLDLFDSSDIDNIANSIIRLMRIGIQNPKLKLSEINIKEI